jgi:hypothetical protein
VVKFMYWPLYLRGNSPRHSEEMRLGRTQSLSSRCGVKIIPSVSGSSSRNSISNGGGSGCIGVGGGGADLNAFKLSLCLHTFCVHASHMSIFNGPCSVC